MEKTAIENIDAAKEVMALGDIAKRYNSMRVAKGFKELDQMELVMDLDYAHQDVPLDIAGLLAASDKDFTRDVMGIILNLDRVNKVLQNSYVPKFAYKMEKA